MKHHGYESATEVCVGGGQVVHALSGSDRWARAGSRSPRPQYLECNFRK